MQCLRRRSVTASATEKQLDTRLGGDALVLGVEGGGHQAPALRDPTP